MVSITLSKIFGNLFIQFPTLLCCIAAGALILTGCRRHKKSARLALAGVAAMFISYMAQVFLWPVMWHFLSSAEAYDLARLLEPGTQLALGALKGFGIVFMALALMAAQQNIPASNGPV